MYKYNKIGSYFREGEHLLKVVECEDKGASCRGCWYNSYKRNTKIRNYPYSCCIHKHACTAAIRKDGKQVLFKEI